MDQLNPLINAGSYLSERGDASIGSSPFERAHNRFNAIQCNASPKWISRILAVRVNLVVVYSFELRHLLCLRKNLLVDSTTCHSFILLSINVISVCQGIIFTS